MTFPKNVFSAFGIIFLITALIIPLENLLALGPEISLHLYLSSELTAEKVSIGVIGLAIFMFVLAYKNKDSIYEKR